MPAQVNARAGATHDERPRRLSVGNWSVSTRLAALCAMASVLGLVFGGLRISAALDTSDAYTHTVQLAVIGSKITALAQAMEDERDRAAGYMAVHNMLVPAAAADHAGPKVVSNLNTALDTADAQLTSAEAVTNVDASVAAAAVRGIGSAFPSSIQSKAANVLTQIAYIPSKIAGLRSEIALDSPSEVIGAYSGMLSILFALDNEITTGSGDVTLGDDVRALSSLSAAEDQASQQRAILYGALLDSALSDAGTNQKPFNNVGGPAALNNFGGLDAFSTAQDLELAYQLSFDAVATTAQSQAYLKGADSPVAGNAQLLENLVTTAGDPTVIFPLASGFPKSAGTTLGYTNAATSPTGWYNDMSAIIDGMRTVDDQLSSSIVARSQFLQHQAFDDAILTAVVVGVAVLLVLLAAALVARSMVNPLRRLQRDALEIAAVKLPERVAAAAAGSELAEIDADAFNRVEPIGVQTTDEIGRVARAFDQVHAEAVRLAGTEAQLRSNLNAMFISLSRRSVPLIDRLSRMIDSLEQNEDDPDQLGALFAMDHLITRMRRNSENLLVLAGEEPVRKWSEPVPLTDVARAAAAEIEQYDRVALTVQSGIMVSGQAAADVVHLLAELLENATLFSPRNTQVQVAAADAPGGGVLIEIRDEGVGVSAARLAEMNWRLDHPPGVDVSVSRHMGLFAVSRLAARRGIRVRLRAGAPQGLTAMVWLPGTLTSHEQPPTIGHHSRPQAGDVSLADEMAFAEVLPAESDLLQRTARQGGRHRVGLLAGNGEQAVADRGYAAIEGGYPADGGRPAGAGQREQRSVWFAAKTPSAASGQAPVASAQAPVASGQALSGAGGPPPAPAGNGWQPEADWGTSGRLTAGAHYTGSYSAVLAARAVDGEDGAQAPLPQTRAGLPLRVPQATTGFAAQPFAQEPAQNDVPVLGAPPGPAGPGGFGGAQRQATQQAPRRRSPEAARSRMAGFQLGSRDAERAGSTAPSGNGSRSGNGTSSGNGTWAAFSRADGPPNPSQPR